ncbi:SGNH/GDSL hydrolase family protein [Rhizobium sp. 768_B6_N1_8]|uniref:SGNH/GDSL hydrolase family protein n=1 Tax=unclassified Rhizobium TaxID=2613769 RepID=UPI003F29C627
MKKLALLVVAVFVSLAGHATADELYGRENLAAFFAAEVRSIKTGEAIKIHIVGDSKVAGNGATDGFRLDQLLKESSRGFPVNVTFDGYGGQNSYLFKSDVAADFIAKHSDADLLIVDFGTNERVHSAAGGPQTIEQTKQNNLDAIARIRSARGLGKLSILFLGQPPANNWQPAYSQTTEVMAEINTAIKDVAAKTNSGYFDTLQLFGRPHSEAGWMEQLPTPEYGGGNVHTGDAFNLVFIGELSKDLFPMEFPKGAGSRW